jgi:hypothetical protein
MTVIDLTEKIDDIRDRYGLRYWASDEARQEMIALWGNPPCNDCGVFERDETIRIAPDGQKSCYGELRIAVAPNGWHAVSTSYWYGQGGGGSSPSVWNRVAYTTRHEAVAAGIASLVEKFDGIRDQTEGSVPTSQPADAERMLKALKDYTAQARQMTLF